MTTLSFFQRQLWMLQKLSKNASFLDFYAYEWAGDLDPTVLQQAMNDLASRHVILSTSFEFKDGQLQGQCADSTQFPLEFVDSRNTPLSLDALIAKASSLLHSTPPKLFRTGLWQTGENQATLWFVAHRLIVDQQSMDVFVHELVTAFHSRSMGQVPDLPSLEVSYATWANDLQLQLENGDFSEDIAYWKEKLHGPLYPIDLLTDFERPASKTYHGDLERLVLADPLVEQIVALAKHKNIEIQTLLFAALSVLIYRYTGNSEHLLGRQISLRQDEALKNTIGPMQNMQPIRFQLEDGLAFDAWLEGVAAQSHDSLARLNCPYPKILEELALTPDPSRAPLCDVLFSYFDRSHTPTCAENVRVTPLAFSTATSIADLELRVENHDKHLHLSFIYSTDLFEPQTVKRMLGHLRTLLEGMVAAPNTPIQLLPIMTNDERELLDRWNHNVMSLPTLCAFQQFEHQAIAMPERVAVVFEDQSLTYKELNQRANRLAHYLLSQGIKAETTIGVYMQRTPDMIVSLLAIWKAGAAYVPLDPAFPVERLSYMITDAEIAVVITQQSLLADLESSPVQFLCIDTCELPEVTHNPNIPVGFKNLAYIIYTSGSTGKPKGVQVEHGGVSNVLKAMLTEPGLSAEDIVLAVTTISFDMSVIELFLPLYAGASLVLCPREISLNPHLFMEEIERRGVTLAQATPSTWQMLIEAGWKGNSRISLITGGEALPKELAGQLLLRCKTLWNMYGPTEASVWTTLAKITQNDRITIGKPLKNSKIFIVDKAGQRVPIGVAGELWIGGCQLARGYSHLPELTAEKFFSPAQAEFGPRVYRTGDLARFYPDGTIDYRGRIDHQVKIRGFRIELGEIETSIGEFPDITRAVVIPREDLPGGKQLVAYLQSSPDTLVNIDALRTYLQGRLPYYMVPTYFVVLKTFPLTTSGKIDRKLLPIPVVEPLKARSEVLPARNETEQALIEIWENELGVSGIGISDNFFSLGGNSLKAVRMMMAVEKKLGKKIPLSSFFRTPSVETLALSLTEKKSVTWSCLVPISTTGSGNPLFLIHGMGGTVIGYYPLASRLAGERPIYGIQARGVEGGRSPQTNIADMAATYIEEIKKVQPKGPYCLGGLSFGGLVALEIAQQLKAQGDEIEALIMFDTNAVGAEKLDSPSERTKRYVSTLFKRSKLHVNNLMKLPIKNKIFYLMERFSIIRRRLHWSYNSQRYKAFLGQSEDVPQLFHDVGQACWLAMNNYRPSPYAGNVLLLRAIDEPFSAYLDRCLGWGEIVQGSIDVRDVPGDHMTFTTEEHADALADAVRNYLSRDIR